MGVCAQRTTLGLMLATMALLPACHSSSSSGGGDSGTGTDADSDSDTDSDTDTDNNTDTDSDSDTDIACDNGVWEGHLDILGAADVAALSGYTEIQGDLNVYDTTLFDLYGLECLATVGGFLQFYHNVNLTDLYGLSNLTTVGEQLCFSMNDTLANVDGLSGITSVGGGLWISGNDTLANLDGLSGITSVGGSLVFELNPALPDCEVCELLDQLTSGPTLILVNDNLDDSCTPISENCEAYFDPCPDYTGDDPCCLTHNPCGWELNDICDCDSACAWDAVDCEW